MIANIQETPSPQVCAGKIFEISGTQLDPDAAAALYATNTFLQMMPRIRPSLTDGMIEDFQKDSIAYARA